MSHAEAFLHAIQANPEDDTPRLVFADWLDEHGDPERAEFIRVQIELARTPWPAPRWFPLHSRQEELLRANRERWLEGLPKDCWPKVGFERGFVASVSATGKQFLRWSARLKERTPLVAVGLDATEKVFAELMTRPVFAGIRQLVLRQMKWPEEFRLLARCPHFSSLSSLCFWYVPGFVPEMLAALLRPPAFPALRALQLNDHALWSLTAEHLQGADVLRRLTDLHLWRCRLGPLQWEALLGEPHGMCEPRQLRLWQCGIGFEELKVLTRLPTLRTVEELCLYGNPIDGEGAKMLAGCPRLSRLRTLSLQGLGSGGVGDVGAIALARSRRLPNLEALDLRSNEITDEGARALLEPAHLPRLRELNLNYNPAVSEETLARLRQRYEMPTM